MFNEGISTSGDLPTWPSMPVIDKSAPGSTMARSHRPGPRERQAIPQGHPELFDEVRRGVLAAKASNPPAAVPVTDDEDEGDPGDE